MQAVLSFNNVVFNPVVREGSFWLRASELARALGYKRDDSVSKIYRENVDEFAPDMTQVIEIIGNAESAFPMKSRVFSLRGCHLIAMFARTPVAKEFRRWVLDVLDRVTGQPQRVVQPQPLMADSLSELPPDILGISPRKRERYFGLALQAVRVTGQTDPVSLRQTFIALCRGLSAMSADREGPVDADREVREFVRQCCEYGPFVCRTAELYDAYNDWCRETGLAPALALKTRTFAHAFAQLPNVYIRRKRPYLIFEGIRLRDGWMESLRQEVLCLEEARHA